MNFLIIETSGDDSSVALSNMNGEIEVKLLPHSKQSTHLLPFIKKLLKENDLTLDDITCIAIGIGPGTFTGTRIGVMTAKTLSFAKNIPLVPFDSLKRFIPANDGSFLTILDAKSQGFYVQKGLKKDSQIIFDGNAHLLQEKTLISLIEKQDILLSPHIDKIQTRLEFSSPKWEETQTNFPYLVKHIKEQFSHQKTRSHQDVKVAYLS